MVYMPVRMGIVYFECESCTWCKLVTNWDEMFSCCSHFRTRVTVRTHGNLTHSSSSLRTAGSQGRSSEEQQPVRSSNHWGQHAGITWSPLSPSLLRSLRVKCPRSSILHEELIINTGRQSRMFSLSTCYLWHSQFKISSRECDTVLVWDYSRYALFLQNLIFIWTGCLHVDLCNALDWIDSFVRYIHDKCEIFLFLHKHLKLQLLILTIMVCGLCQTDVQDMSLCCCLEAADGIHSLWIGVEDANSVGLILCNALHVSGFIMRWM